MRVAEAPRSSPPRGLGGDRLQGGIDDQHVAAGPYPCDDVRHRPEREAIAEERDREPECRLEEAVDGAGERRAEEHHITAATTPGMANGRKLAGGRSRGRGPLRIEEQGDQEREPQHHRHLNQAEEEHPTERRLELDIARDPGVVRKGSKSAWSGEATVALQGEQALRVCEQDGRGRASLRRAGGTVAGRARRAPSVRARARGARGDRGHVAPRRVVRGTAGRLRRARHRVSQQRTPRARVTP